MALIKRDRENFWILNWLDEYMTGHKGFICGGCFKNIFNKEKVKDLDIFFENESDFDDAVQYFDSQTSGYDGDDELASGGDPVRTRRHRHRELRHDPFLLTFSFFISTGPH